MKIEARKLRIEQQELLRQQIIWLRLEKKTFCEIGQLLSIQPDTAGCLYKCYQVEGNFAIVAKKRGPKNKLGRLHAIQQQKVIETMKPHARSLQSGLCPLPAPLEL
ncbi:hypothetical protein [Xenorhabdus sp. SGI246]|uniref:hypothetical protein n=1 Tax=Xenorhabdus sp. SGI246 TaxID=3158263 RepID=UPI00349F91D0